MNEIIFNNTSMPVVSGCGLLAASEPFYHIDRTADFNVMIYVLEGAIYVTEDGSDYEIERGGLIFLKNGIHHFGKREIPKGTRWFYAHFYFNEQPVYESVFAPLPKCLEGLLGSGAEERIMDLCDFCSLEDGSRDRYINLRFAELLSFLAYNKRENAAPLKLSDRICEFLSENISAPFSAKALEGEFFLSYKRLAAVFKAEKGMSMQQYHDRLKMSEARRLLSSTLMSVGEVAMAAGYEDPLYFSRRFRDMTGSSPTEFRRAAAMKM
ncbi:MAG: AraC family transcriptional regulator [Oscillospiraceae bacterium]|nr:AraC family transcriptional regulator [Oscillospiraceae bacterium]MDY6208522.1 AraC family transcriptional regulator [Oscillospiraceae bacterium]